MKAMKMVLVHLLAIHPLDTKALMSKTQIPKTELEEILPRVGRRVEGQWQLSDRAYRDLDPWSFPYPEKADREAAIANAVKAFDRLRLGKVEKLWQILLSPSERGKGVVLSRLHLGSSAQGGKGLTPSYHPSPVLHSQSDGLGERGVVSGANTPRAPGGLTPRPGSSRGGVVKRLLSRDPRKARAMEEAKAKKRKERDSVAAAAGGSEREGGRVVEKLVGKQSGSQVKSEEFVRSEDEGSEGETAVVRPECRKRGESGDGAGVGARKARAETLSSESSDAPLKTQSKSKSPLASPRPSLKSDAAGTAPKAKSSTSHAKSPAPGATTPFPPSSKPEKLTTSPTERKTQQRPRVSSINSHGNDREAIRARIFSPRGRAGDVKEGRARVDTVLGTAEASGLGEGRMINKDETKLSGGDIARKARQKATSPSSKPLANGTGKADAVGSKRQVDHDASRDEIVVKKRKITPTASPHSASQQKLETPHDNNNDTSPSEPLKDANNNPNPSSPSAPALEIESLTYPQALTSAHDFLETYYPAYNKLYDELQAKIAKGEVVGLEEHGRLMAMHRRLEGMKGEIFAAAGDSQREEGQ